MLLIVDHSLDTVFMLGTQKLSNKAVHTTKFRHTTLCAL